MLRYSTMDDKLNELYFHLPIMRGEMQQAAADLGVCRQTVSSWLCRLQTEGLAKRVWNGWVKCYDWSEDDQ